MMMSHKSHYVYVFRSTITPCATLISVDSNNVIHKQNFTECLNYSNIATKHLTIEN